MEAKLKDVLLVLKYVSQKDVFMRYHKTHLTRRLILETSQDSEKEGGIAWRPLCFDRCASIASLFEVFIKLPNRVCILVGEVHVIKSINQLFYVLPACILRDCLCCIFLFVRVP